MPIIRIIIKYNIEHSSLPVAEKTLRPGKPVLERVHPLKDSSRVRVIWDCDSSRVRVHLKMLESSPSPTRVCWTRESSPAFSNGLGLDSSHSPR